MNQISIGKDGYCKCSQEDICPNGKIASETRCRLEKISTISLAKESKKLGVDIVDLVNKNFKKLLLKIK
jgi:hypothetical protein